ncbi:MAG: four helix bundle protein [Bacteroidota bacterium]
MEKKTDLCERLLQFAVDVILYLRTVKNSVETIDTKRQLIKSSTSSGANYEESQGSLTKPDVRTKIGISLKEMRESNYWLRIYSRMKLGNVEQSDYLVKESSELKLILASILNKLAVFFFFSWGLKFGIWGLGLIAFKTIIG